MPTWYYFVRPTNLAFHDLRQQKQKTNLSKYIKSLLGLGLKFCPTPRRTTDTTTITRTLDRHQRDLWLRYYFKGKPPDNEQYNPRLYTPSTWMPPDFAISQQMKNRFSNFSSCYRKLFTR
jgi:hypothetical protein